MKKLFLFAIGILFSVSAWAQSSADKLGWQLAVHSYSYREFSIFDAIDKQLGLKLEMHKRMIPVLVIDHIEEKPTDN